MIKRLSPIIGALFILAMISPVLMADDFSPGDKHLGGRSLNLDTDGATPSLISTIQAENYDTAVGTQLENGNTTVGSFQNGDYIRFDGVNLEAVSQMAFSIASGIGQGSIEVRLDSLTGPLLGIYNITATADWDTFQTRTIDTTGAVGTHSIYLVASSSYTENGQTVIQAEDANTIGGGVTVDTNNPGYDGTGFVNFPGSGGYIEFTNVDGGLGGGGTLVVNEALGGGDREGTVTINGTTSPFNCAGTGDWSTYTDMPAIDMNFTSGATNTIRFDSTGNDLCNIDDITLNYPGNVPARVANLDWIQLWGNENVSQDVDLRFGSGTGKTLKFDSTNQKFTLTDPVQISTTGEALRVGDGTASDHYLILNDGSSRQFGWDDSEGQISTFDRPLRYRLAHSADPPGTCGSAHAYQQWMDSDNGGVYICDTSNSRNKWLSVNEFLTYGEENASCAAGADPNSSEGCNLDWGHSLGADTATNLGFWIPNPITITGYGYSQSADTCTSGSFDVEVWGTGSSSDDNNYTLDATVAAGLNGQAHNSNTLNIDVAGGQYIIVGLDNNCGQTLSAYNIVLYYRQRHN